MNNENLEKLWKKIPSGEGIDDAARKYAEAQYRQTYEFYQSKALELGLTGKRVLDAGCGTGHRAFPFAELFERVDGVDLSEGRIHFARAKAKQLGFANVFFEHGDVRNLPYDDSSFDLVFCYGVLISYIPPQEMFAEFSRVLRAGGKLFVVLNGLGWSYHLRDTRGGADDTELGKGGIYNTLVGSNHAVTAESLRNRARGLKVRLRIALTQLRKANLRSNSAEALLSVLAWRELDVLARQIEEECGREYLNTFTRDVMQIISGSTDTFSRARGGRGHFPEQIEADLGLTGFREFRWGQEDRLFAVAGQEFTRGNLVNGLLSTWEFLASRE